MENISSLPPNDFNIAHFIRFLTALNPSLYRSVRSLCYRHMSSVITSPEEIGFTMNKILRGIRYRPETCRNLFTCYSLSVDECVILYSVMTEQYHI